MADSETSSADCSSTRSRSSVSSASSSSSSRSQEQEPLQGRTLSTPLHDPEKADPWVMGLHRLSDEKRRPLIESAKNKWISSKTRQDVHQLPSFLTTCRLSPRWRRYIALWVLMAAIFWTGWHWWFRDVFREHRALMKSVYGKPSDGWFGSNQSPHFVDFHQVKDLSKSFVPDGTVVSGKPHKRLIVIGDVHGCKDECKSP
jgi:hypothetical protein